MASTRETVLDMLLDINEKGSPSHIVMGTYLARAHELDERDRAFIKKLCQGVVERRITLDRYIGCLSSVPVRKLKPVIRNVLRMGLYQMAYMSVPDSAACNESVKLVKKRGFANLSGFVNAVLRNYARRATELSDLSSIADPAERLSVMYSCPEWIVSMWLDTYGYEQVEEMLRYFLTDNMTSIRVNTSLTGVEELTEMLRSAGVNVTPGRYSHRSLRISDYGSLERLESFRAGLFTVQDESSVLAGELAGIGPDDKVLDICAAPGGKSLNAADLILTAGGHGTVTSCDVSDGKVALIRDNIDRCGFKNITAVVSDATVRVPEFEGAFDTVIADVPCSGLGIMGKKPDIRYNMTPDRINDLVVLQRAILDNAVAYVRPGGRLVFSTCTVDKAENEDNTRYLTDRYGLRPVSPAGLNGKAGDALSAELLKNGSVQLLPGIDGTDGFYISVLEV